MKTFYLHAGAIRTGSTAFQMQSVENGKRLRLQGFYYPSDPIASTHDIIGYAEQFISGNINALVDLIGAGNSSPDQMRAAVVQALDQLVGAADKLQDSNIVFSSENLMWLTEAQLRLLRDAIADFLGSTDVRVVLVFCVRDLIDHALSWWAHSRRRHALAVDRMTYLIHQYENVQYNFLQKALHVFDRPDILCVHYQREMSLWRTLADFAKVELPDDLVNLQNFADTNQALSLEALDFLQSLVPLLPDGSWSTAPNGQIGQSTFFDNLTKVVAKVDVKGADIQDFDGKSWERIRINFKEKFEQQIAWMNEALDIKDGPLRLHSPSDRGAAAQATLPSGDTTLIGSRNSRRERLAMELLAEVFRSNGQPAWIDSETLSRIEKAALVRNSAIFEYEFYRADLARVSPPGLDVAPEVAISHFLQFGVAAGASPSPFFDVAWYRSSNRDLNNQDPVLHYVIFGAAEGRSPHPLIPPATAKLLRHAGNLVGLLNLYARMVVEPAAERRVPPALLKILKSFSWHATSLNEIEWARKISESGLFDNAFYREQLSLHPPIDLKLVPPTDILHFLKYGCKLGVSPCRYFDSVWYSQTYPDLRGTNPVLHYIDFGSSEGRRPHPKISPKIAAAFKYLTPPETLAGLLVRSAREASDAEKSNVVPSNIASILKQFA